jgi:cyanophycinase
MDTVRRRYSSWKNADIASFDVLHTDSPKEADTRKFVETLNRATGVWIGGGSQSRLTYRYGDTLVEKALRGVLERGGVVGGTSAGAAVMSEVMIRYGVTSDPAVGHGFGFLQDAIVDQHFTQRNREKRLVGVLENHPGMVGLGIDEGTALIVTGNHLHVLGSGRVAVFIGPNGKPASTVYRLSGKEEADLVAIAAASRGKPAKVGLRKKA